jgi:HEAT repeat protein
MNRSLRLMSVALAVVIPAGCGADPQYTVAGLMKKLDHPDPVQRCTAVELLGKYGAAAKPAVPQLTAALKDSDTSVRIAAAYALAGIGLDADSALPDLIETLKSDNAELRLAAVYAIPCVDIQSNTALEALKPLQKDRDPRVRDEVAQGLRKLQNAAKYRSLAPPATKS